MIAVTNPAYRRIIFDEFVEIEVGNYRGVVRKGFKDKISKIPESEFESIEGCPHEAFWIKPLKYTETDKPPSRFVNNVILYERLKERRLLDIPKPMGLLYPSSLQGEVARVKPVYIAQRVKGVNPNKLNDIEARKIASIISSRFDDEELADFFVLLDVASRDIVVTSDLRAYFVDNENVVWTKRSK